MLIVSCFNLQDVVFASARATVVQWPCFETELAVRRSGREGVDTKRVHPQSTYRRRSFCLKCWKDFLVVVNSTWGCSVLFVPPVSVAHTFTSVSEPDAVGVRTWCQVSRFCACTCTCCTQSCALPSVYQHQQRWAAAQMLPPLSGFHILARPLIAVIPSEKIKECYCFYSDPFRISDLCQRRESGSADASVRPETQPCEDKNYYKWSNKE